VDRLRPCPHFFPVECFILAPPSTLFSYSLPFLLPFPSFIPKHFFFVARPCIKLFMVSDRPLHLYGPSAHPLSRTTCCFSPCSPSSLTTRILGGQVLVRSSPADSARTLFRPFSWSPPICPSFRLTPLNFFFYLFSERPPRTPSDASSGAPF